jgi:hypothetical protein
MATQRPMTASELLDHPEYQHTVWPLKPAQSGKLPVALGRGGPINIAYEVHGHGPRHLVVGDTVPRSIFRGFQHVATKKDSVERTFVIAT